MTQAKQSLYDTRRENALSVSQAQSVLNVARKQLAADKAAGADPQVLAQDKQAVTQATQGLASARSRATTSNHQAANQVTNAKLSLTKARHDYGSQVAPADDATIASDEAQVAQADSGDNGGLTGPGGLGGFPGGGQPPAGPGGN